MIVSKRELAATFARRSGLTSLLATLPKRPGLLVLNYHRIGNAEECEYDSETFSATCEELDEQIRFLKRHCRLASLDEAIEMAEAGGKSKLTAVLLTFDDGYLDNYESAFPILTSHGVPGVFFLPTSYIGTNYIPWWDAIAYIVKTGSRKEFALAPPWSRRFDTGQQGERTVIRAVLDLYKSAQMEDGDGFMAMLEEACDAARPQGGQRSFMTWEEAAAMQRAGMAIGSHTRRHEILSKLTVEEQFEELRSSKREIEERLGSPVTAIAYPVGLTGTFSPVTLAAAEQTGYRAGFSFYGGFNPSGRMERFDIRRAGVARPTKALFELQTTLTLATGKHRF
jgi:peptidoglycan/xylan/chitin deacetylase (PgdA/CDA1 family)